MTAPGRKRPLDFVDFRVPERPLSGKADTRTFERVRELCESVLMGCDESCVSQRASAGSI